MRTPLLALGLLMGLLVMPAVPAVAAAAADMATGSAALAAQQPPQIDVDVNAGGAAWYTDPIWIAIGVIALVVLILLIAMATRRNNTTVIRE